jgi:hypothetical protein
MENASPELQMAINQKADDKVISCLSEIITNLLDGCNHLTASQKKKQTFYKALLRRLIAKKDDDNNQCRVGHVGRIFILSGGALPTQIPLMTKFTSKACIGKVVAAKKRNNNTKKIIKKKVKKNTMKRCCHQNKHCLGNVDFK